MSQCKPAKYSGLEAHVKSTIMCDYPVTLNTLANVPSMSELSKFGGSCMHRKGYSLVYIYSSIRGKEQLIPCCQTQYTLICTSLVPRPEEQEEEKGFGFSRLSMRLIAVEFHGDCILLTYFCTLVMLKSILHITLSIDLLEAYSV